MILANRFGAISRIEVRRAEILVEEAARKWQERKKRVAKQENRKRILLSRNPHALARGTALTGQALPLALPAELSSALLERKPDISMLRYRDGATSHLEAPRGETDLSDAEICLFDERLALAEMYFALGGGWQRQ